MVFSAAIVTVAGALGVIIPPSISYIVYSAAANASPSALFIAGIIPGCLIGFFLMAYCWYYCKKNGEDKEKLQENYNKIRRKRIPEVIQGKLLRSDDSGYHHWMYLLRYLLSD